MPNYVNVDNNLDDIYNAEEEDGICNVCMRQRRTSANFFRCIYNDLEEVYRWLFHLEELEK